MSLIAQDPMRSIRWRWDRAIALSYSKKISATKLDDDYVVDAARYVRRYRIVTDKIIANSGEHCDSDSALLEVRQKWPDLMAAVSIYMSAEFMRWAVEALVCANATTEEIAKPFGVKPRIIELYELYFFDVRSRRGNNLWLTHALLSPAVRDGMSTTNWDFFWKGLALWHGKDVLNAFWEFGTLPEDVGQKLEEFNRSIQLRNVARANLVRPVTPLHAHDIIDEANASKAEDSQDAQSALMSGAGQMLGAIGFRIASQTTESPAVEYPLDAINGESHAPEDIPDLPAGGVMSSRQPDVDAAERFRNTTKDSEDDEESGSPPAAVEEENYSAAVKSEPVQGSPANLEQEQADVNARLRAKKDAILKRAREKKDQN